MIDELVDKPKIRSTQAANAGHIRVEKSKGSLYYIAIRCSMVSTGKRIVRMCLCGLQSVKKRACSRSKAGKASTTDSTGFGSVKL